ncbi:uncharacterized protein B0J16DRAFT_348524 [Fusarium flagelliforme]|uniref:Secreted protein CSS2 C-terminal domain-containing protein n=1 Tax=Fusarium flagelliforme TaxID=2675880 RepID=A0A395MCI4_9HYPO|nr:uncharacterized protein B0J16DRAFT_348524 [Fusarium flagelliforme]KAH7174371.1 hypothetical protein B0J16DRAFT_348524 [Fusarium flagelliforme]RFN45588.1 hypothetical protein FIE12Z_10142 [Fusarium flagelliforme]
MASPTSSNSPAPGMFSEITTRFIVPFFLVTLNLVAYKTSNDGRLPAFNVFISLYLLSAYFRRGKPSSTTVTSSDDKSVQKAESPKSNQKQKKTWMKVLFGIVVCCALAIPIKSLVELALDQFGNYDDVLLPMNYGDDCGTMVGTAGPDQEVRYKYYSAKGSCDTMAERDTIRGAIEEQIKKNYPKDICETQCLDLRKTGLWNGWLLVGPHPGFDSDKYCGPDLPDLKFGECGQRKERVDATGGTNS